MDDETIEQIVKGVAAYYVKAGDAGGDKGGKIVAKALEIVTCHLTAELGSKATGIPTN